MRGCRTPQGDRRARRRLDRCRCRRDPGHRRPRTARARPPSFNMVGGLRAGEQKFGRGEHHVQVGAPIVSLFGGWGTPEACSCPLTVRGVLVGSIPDHCLAVCVCCRGSSRARRAARAGREHLQPTGWAFGLGRPGHRAALRSSAAGRDRAGDGGQPTPPPASASRRRVELDGDAVLGDLIRSIRGAGTTDVVGTTSGLVDALCDRVTVLSERSCSRGGRTEAIAHDPAHRSVSRLEAAGCARRVVEHGDDGVGERPASRPPASLLRDPRSQRVHAGHIAPSAIELRRARRGRFGIIGANGAGKTSTLRALMGLIKFDAGVDHELTAGGSTRRSRRRIIDLGIGYIPEGRHVFPGLSVRKNLLLGAPAGQRIGGAASSSPAWSVSTSCSCLKEFGAGRARRRVERRTATDARDWARPHRGPASCSSWTKQSMGFGPVLVNEISARLRATAKGRSASLARRAERTRHLLAR